MIPSAALSSSIWIVFRKADETIITEDGITLQVKEINQNRIKKVSMTLPEETGEDSDTGASEEDSTPSAEQEQENQAGS